MRNLRMFTQHVNYEDLHVFEAVSMVAVALFAVTAGVSLALSAGMV